MALSTAADYKTVLYKIVNIKGPNRDAWIRFSGIAAADADQIVTEYKAWKLTQGDRIHEPQQTTAH